MLHYLRYLTVALCVGSTSVVYVPLAQSRPLPVIDAVTTPMPLTGSGYHDHLGTRFLEYSPDRSHYLTVILRDDVARDGTEFIFFRGDNIEGSSAKNIRPILHLFSLDRRDDQRVGFSPTYASHFSIQWADNVNVFFQWNDGKSATQVYQLNMNDGNVRQITHSDMPVIRYSVSPRLRYLVYSTTEPDSQDNDNLQHRGFAVASLDYGKILQGHLSGYEPWDHIRYHVLDIRTGHAIPVDAKGMSLPLLQEATDFSADDRYAIIKDIRPVVIPASWSLLTGTEIRKDLTRNKKMPQPDGYAPPEWALLDLQQGKLRLLTEFPAGKAKVCWMSDGTIVYGPTYYTSSVSGAAGRGGDAVLMIDAKSLLVKQVRDSSATTGTARCGAGVTLGAPGPEYVYWSEGLNSRPRLLAKGKGGNTTVLLDPMAGLQNFSLGFVSAVSWSDREGNAWTGHLYYPAGFVRHHRYPFVIQTHGFATYSGYSLQGNAPEITTAFAAQLLASRGFMVLQVNEESNRHAPNAELSPLEAELAQQAYESAIDHFSAIGIIDPARVGLVGFSRSSWWVLYTLTHATHRFAAAVVADGIDGSYVQSTLNLNGGNGEEFAQDNGAAPYGAGLIAWLRNSPGFLSDKITAPLRMEIDSGGIGFAAGYWELFSRMRSNYQAAELYVVPDAQFGDHPIQIPAQKLASQEGTVDWMEYWLQGHKDPSPSKRDQYARWDRLRSEMTRAHRAAQ